MRRNSLGARTSRHAPHPRVRRAAPKGSWGSACNPCDIHLIDWSVTFHSRQSRARLKEREKWSSLPSAPGSSPASLGRTAASRGSRVGRRKKYCAEAAPPRQRLHDCDPPHAIVNVDSTTKGHVNKKGAAGRAFCHSSLRVPPTTFSPCEAKNK